MNSLRVLRGIKVLKVLKDAHFSLFISQISVFRFGLT